MKSLKLYIAGKVAPDSEFGTHDWRDGFCATLSKLSALNLINLDPTKHEDGFTMDVGNPKLVVGRDSYMIKIADAVIVHLTDDISVGGSQEMLIAKHFNKPLIGLAPIGGKFYRAHKTIRGIEYTNWIHPFVDVTCDKVVSTIEELAIALQELPSAPKTVNCIDEAVAYYEHSFLKHDEFLNNL
jgi:hypothetical protein